MKKIAVLLIVLLAFQSITIGAFAAETVENHIYVIIENGKYITANNKVGALKAEKINDGGIYELKDGTLLAETGTEYYQKVRKYEANLSDEVSITDLMNIPYLGDEVKEDILKESTRALSTGNIEANVTLFLPEKPKGRTSSTEYFTYDGYNMKETLVYYGNVDTPWEIVEEGDDTLDVASILANATVNGASIAYLPVSLVTGGLSLLEAFINGTGYTPIYANYENRMQYRVFYDVYTKYTYVDLEDSYGYRHGATTQKVYLRKSETDQRYLVNSVFEQHVESITHNQWLISKYYNTAKDVAIDSVTDSIPVATVNYLKYKVHNLTIYF